MKKYEVMYIVNSALEDAKRQEVIETLNGIITTNGGNVTKVDDWGIKEYAYEIEKAKKGHYVVVEFDATNEALKEFDRLIHINSNVVRYMIVSKED